MIKEIYPFDRDYILEVLKKAEDETFDEIVSNLPQEIQFAFGKYVSIRNAKEKIKIQIALNNDHEEMSLLVI